MSNSGMFFGMGAGTIVFWILLLGIGFAAGYFVGRSK